MISPGRVAFTIFGVDIMWYGLLIGMGFLLALIISYYRAPKFGIKSDHILDYLIVIIPCAIIGARAYYVIFSWDSYAGNWAKIFDIRSGGLAIHGGLILGIIGAFVLSRFLKDNILDVADLLMPTVALGQAIGRWGNFFNEEAHGYEIDGGFAVIINGHSYVPTFFYESIWCLLLFIFLIWYSKKRKFKGQIALLYGMLYSVERFVVEGFRTDSLMIGSLRQAQVISIGILLACLVLYIILYMNYRRKK
ncbi:MAG: prolipoprotein diacylglyceryl transferase [Clostridia bacterium]|nr:prolipoprotein diacylglyceryl transferase [Clostridia bacterium]